MKLKVNRAKLIQAIAQQLKISHRQARDITNLVEVETASDSKEHYVLDTEGKKLTIGKIESEKPLVRHGTSGTGAGSSHVIVTATGTRLILRGGRKLSTKNRKTRVGRITNQLKVEVVDSNNSVMREQILEYGLTRRERQSPRMIHGTSGTGAGNKEK
ncbi:MAG: hypothetical protein QUV19_03630 [Alteromonas macleodii]|uniref:hypothetical protein n=1 Tax=Alteromonas TaxID=226 RepID=UPI001287BF50|nr:hypothetical protein [Alteromonas macleodii]MDM7961204.1 hypothetical protein [Alteromonas macleodii]MDM8169657.1 hypothetical protein [Alteromonas macleodii]CAI3966122.1 hypothetical protein EZ55_03258 [Alteromonas macleodii]VTP57182.1 hypothetical protein EZ55_03258 [Alteromonas macleodii]